MSVELGTSMAVDFDDRIREIHDTGAAPEIEDTAIGASRAFRNPSQLSSYHCIFFSSSSSTFTKSLTVSVTVSK